MLLIVQAFLGQGAFFWPLLIGAVGLALLWRQADEAQRERWLDSTGRIDPVRIIFGTGGWQSVARVVVGLLLIIAAVGVFALREGSISDVATDHAGRRGRGARARHHGRAVDLPAGR